MTAPADNTLWRTTDPEHWLDDTSDVLHCSMPPQVRQHIEELRAEVRRLTARMTPEREAELRALHVPFEGVVATWCNVCSSYPHGQAWPCHTIQALDALAAERAHTQQVEVMHSSTAVLGYVGAVSTESGVRLATLPGGKPYPTLDAITHDWSGSGEAVPRAAVVRITPDGRIGGTP